MTVSIALDSTTSHSSDVPSVHTHIYPLRYRSKNLVLDGYKAIWWRLGLNSFWETPRYLTSASGVRFSKWMMSRHSQHLVWSKEYYAGSCKSGALFSAPSFTTYGPPHLCVLGDLTRNLTLTLILPIRQEEGSCWTQGASASHRNG